MSFEWTDKRDNVDDVMADDINKLASGIKELFEIGKNKEEKSNKVETIDDIDGNHAHYPSEMAVIKYIRNTAELTKNKVGSIADETPLNPYDYPTANAVKSYIDDTVIPSIKSESNKKFALIENGIIEVKETVVGNLNDILVYDKNGDITEDFAKAHSGIFKVYLRERLGSSVILYGNKYLLMNQTVAQTAGQNTYKITQTILSGNELRARSFTSDFIFIPDDEGNLSYGDFDYIDLASKENISNKSTAIDETADNTKYPTTKAVKDYVGSKIDFEKELDAFEPVNILDGITPTIKRGYFWVNGQLVTTSSTTIYNSFEDLLDVKVGCTYKIPSYCGCVMLYDDEGKNEVLVNFNDGKILDREVTVPKGKTKMGVSYRNDRLNAPPAVIYRITIPDEDIENCPFYSDNLSIKVANIKDEKTKSLLSPLKGKIIVNFGDSIFGNARPPEDISTRLAELTGATVHNCGFGGCRMSEHIYPNYDAFSMYQIANAIATKDYSLQDAAIISTEGEVVPSYFAETLVLLKSIDFNSVDIITIAYGTNDWGAHNKANDDLLNEPTTKLDYTHFKGALRYSIETILTAYPHIRIFACGQTYRVNLNPTEADGSDVDTTAGWKRDGYLLSEVINQTKEVAAEYNLPFIDNYSIGINIVNWLQYFPANDGTHQNIEGRKLIASNIAKHLI